MEVHPLQLYSITELSLQSRPHCSTHCSTQFSVYYTDVATVWLHVSNHVKLFSVWVNEMNRSHVYINSYLCIIIGNTNMNTIESIRIMKLSMHRCIVFVNSGWFIPNFDWRPVQTCIVVRADTFSYTFKIISVHTECSSVCIKTVSINIKNIIMYWVCFINHKIILLYRSI